MDNLIKTFDLELFRDSSNQCVGRITRSYEQSRANLCECYATQMINGDIYWCKFVMSYEMINDMHFITDQIRRYMIDAIKNNNTCIQENTPSTDTKLP